MSLPIPNALLTSEFVASIALRYTKDYVQCSTSQRKKIMKLLKTFAKQYQGLTIVDIETASGDVIHITL